ncbi:hypothetical protein [Georgenia sp. AZ-5]|uniref:hypothetical protein n=1 Tax=Georgenia sp. AZ-5 TaxID=3367526 RepID=UPI003754A173
MTMRPKVLIGVVGLVAVTATLAVVVGRSPSLVARLRTLPEDFSAAYRQREAELRAALLPGDDAVVAASDSAAARATRRGRHAADEETDDLPYSFY